MSREQACFALCTEAQLDDMARSARGFAETAFEGTEDSVMPQVLMQYKTSFEGEAMLQVSALAVNFNTEIEKKSVMLQLGSKAYGDRQIPCSVTLISEAWISLQALGERRKYILPEEDPERIEAVIYHTMAVDGRTRHGYRPFTRNPQGKLVALPDQEWTIAPNNAAKSALLAQFYKGFFTQPMLQMLKGGR